MVTLNKILVLLIVILVISIAGVYYLIQKKENKSPIISNNEVKNMENVRRPAVAGSFYPADPKELADRVSSFLKSAELPKESQNKIPKLILVPHAGYDYSGQVAAFAYKALVNQRINEVIILASSHNNPIQGIVAEGSDSWDTPLGKVEVDRTLINQLGFPSDISAFAPEHSLEVQLPFLQTVLPNGFKIVPFLVGDMTKEEKEAAAKKIEDIIGNNTLLVISSDMSHYPTGADATKADQDTIKSILSGKEDQFESTVDQLEQKKIPNALTFMCARPAVEIGMLIAQTIGAKDIQLLKYNNSGDVTGDNSRVVGYSAIAFFGEKKEADSEKTALLKMARDSVENFVKNGNVPQFEEYKIFDEHSGVFVTLKNSGNLRGCIGLMESDKPLYETIPQMAVAAAVDDPRFNPVSSGDLPQLKYEVSVLSPMKRIQDPKKEIKLGTNGVKVQKDGRSGVFLPQVAEETGWTLEEFMNHLCQDKAGLPADCWQDPATEVYTFTAEVFSE